MYAPRMRGIWPSVDSSSEIDCPYCIIFSPDCTADDYSKI